MEKPITLTVLSTQTRAEIRDTITAGDSDAYPLSITFSDLTAITGTVRFRFVRGDDYWDRDATVAGNVASLMLEPAFYAATGTELWVSFEDSNLYTPLHVYFRDIRVPGGNVEAATSQTYPEWAAEMRELDVSIGTVTTLAEGADATASITGTIPDKVLNLGIPVGATGGKGDAATVAVGTVTTLDAGESATVANSGTSGAAVLDFGLPQGAKGDKGDPGDPGLDGSAVPIDDASTAADRVLSASYIKGQLSAIDSQLAQKASLNDISFAVKNRIVNHDFSSGALTPWVLYNATHEFGVFGIRVTWSNYLSYFMLMQPQTFLAGRKYYISHKGVMFNTTGSKFLRTYGSGLAFKQNIVNTTGTFAADNSYLFQPTVDATDLGFGVLSPATGANFTVGEVFVVDLTEIFGIGKEPTKADFETFLTNIPTGWVNKVVTNKELTLYLFDTLTKGNTEILNELELIKQSIIDLGGTV